nr:MAG TPA: AIMP2 lysyl-tRNA synthetase binding domain [Caudoviricetes sp.]
MNLNRKNCMYSVKKVHDECVEKSKGATGRD